MTEEVWRPLGVDSDDEIAKYDALHDGVPDWMKAAFWRWIQDALTVHRRYRDGSGNVSMLDTQLAEKMCQELHIPLPNYRAPDTDYNVGIKQLTGAMATLHQYHSPLRLADYLLANDGNAKTDELDEVLSRSRSAWRVGERSGRPGLVRRVPLGVQVAADAVIARAGRAGIRLAKAWEELYGVKPDASAAYGLAIKSVEDAAVPVVSPTHKGATLGTVLAQIESQGDWKLPMDREHPNAPSADVLVGMMRMLWHGQHDRHGGQPSAPGNVSADEAAVAVGLAVTLVSWFDAGLVARSTP